MSSLREVDRACIGEKLSGQEKRLLVELMVNDIIALAKAYRLDLFDDEEKFKEEARQLLRSLLDRGYQLDFLPPLCVPRV